MYLPYSIVTIGDEKCVKISDPPQVLTAQELWDWIVEIRDTESDRCHELVKIYFQLKKTKWKPSARN